MTRSWPPAEASGGKSEQTVEARQREAAALVAALDDQETAVLRKILAGWGSEEIARDLAIGNEDFSALRAGLLAKLDARSTIDVIRIGIYAGVD